MRLPLFNQLLLTPLAFQIQRLNWIQSQEKELPEGAAPSRGMHGLQGWDKAGRGGQEAPGGDPAFPCPMEIPNWLFQIPKALGSSGIHWHLVFPTYVQLIPNPRAPGTGANIPGPGRFCPTSHHAASSLNHGMIPVGSDPKAPLIPNPINGKSQNWGFGEKKIKE